jgi:hypothetical protein
MGADSLIQGGDDAWNGQPKVWKAGGGKYGVGFCGDLAWGELLRYRVRWPTKVTDLPKRLKDCINNAAARTGYKIQEHKETSECEALFCHAGTIYYIDGDLNIVVDPARDYVAIGAPDVANGALFATRKQSPEKRVLTALKAAGEHSTTCREPWVLLMI